jgi:tRNA (cmo5U34)-methyltransferase
MKKHPFDSIYAENNTEPSEFEFNSEVAEVFPDMIRRSVPGYAQTLDVIEVVAAKFAVPGVDCYDLGCSLGAASFRIERATAEMGCRIWAVDNSPAMIDRLRGRLKSETNQSRIEPLLSDVLDVDFKPLSLAVLAYTLQFGSLERRTGFLETLREAMTPGAALVLAEKISFESAAESELMDSLHMEFKRRNGYSDLEIARKRTALENVLVPETLASHIDRLRSVGFKEVYVVARYLNFATLVALA